ncbi:hypothetical protein KJY77_04050 [Canibacter sp. lx-72]|uniref:hypothetical protein n=1 Tax=Canibacter zhuwentaonis TaxID=2837491 RepID=UPI001BDD247F|nr:hypothetical protein [Canibacter zhuwentaonis]MBT1018311.1 hypothetical protein [Canibacter zhuwentaonis]
MASNPLPGNSAAAVASVLGRGAGGSVKTEASTVDAANVDETYTCAKSNIIQLGVVTLGSDCLVVSSTKTDKQEYLSGENVTIKVKLIEIKDVAQTDFYNNDLESIQVKVRVTIKLPEGFAVTNETFKNCIFQDCNSITWQYNQNSHSVEASLDMSYIDRDSNLNRLKREENITITGVAAGAIGVSNKVTTTVESNLLQGYRDKDRMGLPIDPFGGDDRINLFFYKHVSEATFRVAPATTSLSALFTSAGAAPNTGVAGVNGSISCTVAGGMPHRSDFTFNLDYAQRSSSGFVSKLLSNQVQVGADCEITVNKGMVPAGWRWKDNNPIVLYERNIRDQRTATIPLELERVPVDVAVETSFTSAIVKAGENVGVVSKINALGNEARNVPVTIQLPRDGFVATTATSKPDCQVTGGAACPTVWMYDKASHSLTGTIPLIPVDGSVTVTTSGVAGVFDSMSRNFAATTSVMYNDANQANNTNTASLTVTNTKVSVSGVFKPVGDYPADGAVTVTSDVECVQPIKHKAFFTHTLNYADVANGSFPVKVLHEGVWKGSNCVVTIRKVTAPDGWEFTDSDVFTSEFRNIAGSVRVEYSVAVQRKFVAVAPPLPLTGGVASDWLYLTGAGVLIVGVVAGLVARRRLQARV